LKQSQQQAARAVESVLEGRSLSAALAASGADNAGAARPLVHELAYGTLRHHGTLDALVRRLARKPLPDRALAALVAVALYQLEHTKAPAFAVVDQAVAAAGEIARPAAKGLVNAMLRRFLRERDALLAEVLTEPVARWSHPRWWISRVRSDWPQHWEAVLAAGNSRPPLALRVNVRRTSRRALVERLAAVDASAQVAGECGIVLDVPRPVHELPGFVDGDFSVQDLGAQLVPTLLQVADGQRVLDACAAPGGKATHLLERADIDLTALDSDESRLPRIRENVARLKLEEMNAKIVHADASERDRWWDGVAFDRILADVPCTASGVVRRHPDGKWLRRRSDVQAFARRQDEILDAVWPTLARGGRLLYSTCSVFREENDARVDAFLARTPDALRESISFGVDIVHSGGQLLPSPEGGSHNHDGFFYALLRKS
jgi:16S rRNA (cytosine967-C5)-methyltransferase